MKKTYSLSIAIPAYNEERNIIRLLQSLATQEIQRVSIKNIFVISDASTDKTNTLVSQMRLLKLKLIKRVKRRGKTEAIKTALQEAKKNNSDYLLLIDADLHITSVTAVQPLITALLANPDCLAASGFVVPTRPQNFVQKVGYAGFYIWEEMVKKTKENLYFRSSDPFILLRVKDFDLKEITQYSYLHDEFYFLYALKHNKTITFAKKAQASFILPATLTDYRKQMKRYLSTHFMPDSIYPYKEHQFTARERITALLSIGKKHVPASVAFVCIQLLVKLETSLTQNRIHAAWERIDSTK